MKKKSIGILIILGVIILGVSISIDSKEKDDEAVFHITLADPELYTNGIYTNNFTIESGTYFFRFVPNGSSPEILSIKLSGQNYTFIENFNLKGIPHESETSKYFTWEYEGKKNITIDSMKEVTIVINSNGDVMGSVSVDIIRNPMD
ncbi:MAG: hypothetical protein ACW9XB_07280 [Candidatus Nitrosopumilus sp. metabat.KBP569_Feb_25m_nospike.7]|nr:hypothetical protein [Nitrosopumilus sp.]